MGDEKEQKQTILVIEDDPVVQQLHKRILESAGYNVSLASDGTRGIEILEEIKPDLIILDVMMPGLNGYQTLETIRHTSDVPVIMVTAVRGAETLQKALGLGADDYVTKPFSPSVLLSRVQAKLRRAGWKPQNNATEKKNDD